MPALSDKQLKARIDDLRSTIMLSMSGRYQNDLDTLEELLKRRQTARPIKLVVKLDDSDCGCEDSCSCVPALYLLKDGRAGYGQAVWTYHEDQSKGLMYWCEFLGLAGYWATDMMDAAEQLRDRLQWLGDKVEIQTY